MCPNCHSPDYPIEDSINRILVWNDSGYVNLTLWYFFIIFEYILHISTPHIMIFCFPLPYFPLSTSALFFACTHIVYRRSLVTFYSNRHSIPHRHTVTVNKVSSRLTDKDSQPPVYQVGLGQRMYILPGDLWAMSCTCHPYLNIPGHQTTRPSGRSSRQMSWVG